MGILVLIIVLAGLLALAGWLLLRETKARRAADAELASLRIRHARYVADAERQAEEDRVAHQREVQRRVELERALGRAPSEAHVEDVLLRIERGRK